MAKALYGEFFIELLWTAIFFSLKWA
jgi:hypothetical protein